MWMLIGPKKEQRQKRVRHTVCPQELLAFVGTVWGSNRKRAFIPLLRGGHVATLFTGT